MKQQINAHPRAIAMLMAAVALPLTPAFAQETTAAPPVAETVAPPVAAPAPEPVAPPAAAVPAPVFAPSSPVVQAVPVRPATAPEAVEEAPAPGPKPRAIAARPAPRPAAVKATAPAAAAPVVAASPAPATVAPVAETPVATETHPPVAAEPTPEPTTTIAPEVVDNTPWGMILAGIAALGAIIAGLIFARRRRPAVTERAVPYVAPTIVREPVASITSKPVMREPGQPVAPQSRAPIVAATGERPWIGLSLAPICAGTTEDGTMVQYELIVDNASDVEAHDVRVSSFLIDGMRSSAAEQALIQPLGETQSSTVDIAANGSVPITTTIHVDRCDLTGSSFEPKIVAEARYPLPGGGEGHFAARFAIGITDGDAIKAVGLGKGEHIHEDVGAELDDVLERV